MYFSRPSSTVLGLACLALFLALGHAWLATRAGREKSPTSDEPAHITGGYTFNHWNDYRLHPENGVLPQRWQTLPLMWTGANYPTQADAAWRQSDVWLMGYRFFYQSGNNSTHMLAGARAMNSLFGAATVLLVFFWSWRLWGAPGALVSAVFCALCPTMLAHSGLATSDMCMTFFLLLAMSAYWHHLHDGRPLAWLLSLIAFGLAAVAKYTSVLLLPMALVCVLLRLGRGDAVCLGRRTFSTWPAKSGVMVLSLCVHGLAVMVFIWVFFGFRYSAFNPALPPGDFTFPWELVLSFGGVWARVIDFCRSWRLLPEGWLYGLAFVLKHAEARGAFLDGGYSIYGWMSFFPKAFLYKTPLSLLTGLAAGATMIGVRLRTLSRTQIADRFYRTSPLLVLFVVYWLFSLSSHLNIGHRHLLPVYPVLYVFCGVLGWAALRTFQQSRANGWGVAIAIAALLGWHARVAAGIHPDYLAYFSPVVGGPAQGYKRLVDSSLDWGQDLPGLKKWLQANQRPGERLHLSYFGTAEPDYYGISAVRLPMIPDFDKILPWYRCEPGLYAISASMLQHVYMPQRGAWTLENERQYQGLRLNDASFRAMKNEPDRHPELLESIPLAQWNTAWKLYTQLRFARLCHYLRARQPDAMIGYSILVYRVDQGELDSVLDGDLGELSAAINRALRASARPAIRP